MTGHTPGPWEIKPEGEILRVWEAKRPVAVGVADVCINRSMEARGPSELEHANAHLIAAAPDLLTKLIEGAELQRSDLVGAEWRAAVLKWLSDVDSLVAKVEGKTDE